MELSARFLAFTAYGVQWVLWLLIGLSVISIAMMLERVWHFATYHPSPQLLLQQIRKLLQSGTSDTSSADSLAAAAEGAKVGERLSLERNLAFLGTLGSNAPFIGLFGTVLGIIKAFHDLAGNQAGGPAVVMAGISEALVATAVGLMVAIPAVVAFNYFNRRVRTIMTQVDWMAHLALAQLTTSTAPGVDSSTANASQTQVATTPPVVFLRRLALIGAIVMLALIGGVLIKGGTPQHPHTLVTPSPPPAAPSEPRTVLIPRSPEVNREDAAVVPESPATPTIATAPAPAETKPAAPPVKPAGPRVWKGKKKRPQNGAPQNKPAAPTENAPASAPAASDAAPKEPAVP